MTTAFIGLGSNLQHPAQQLQDAAVALAGLSMTGCIRCSSVYRSAAIGPGQQPDYLNAVAALSTSLAPLALLDALQQIETRQGRVRNQRWAARTLDLDILLYGDLLIDLPRLIVPHPRIPARRFVLLPLAELGDPEMALPDGTRVNSLLAAAPAAAVSRTAVTLCGKPRPQPQLEANH